MGRDCSITAAPCCLESCAAAVETQYNLTSAVMLIHLRQRIRMAPGLANPPLAQAHLFI